MIKIHATKKLLAKLPVDESGFLPEKKPPPHMRGCNEQSESLLSGWHANLITLQRRNCILLVHDTTRFPLFISSLTKPDFVRLDWYFQDVLMNTLLKLGTSQQQMDTAAVHLQRLRFDSNCNRSVQGTMNQMKGDVEHMLWYDNAAVQDLSGYRTGVWLASRPCTVKGLKDCVWPDKAILELLNTLPVDKPDIQIARNNVVNMEDYRK